MLRWVVLGKENRWQNWEFAVGYDTVQGDTKCLIAVFFKEHKERNNRCSFTARCSPRMVAFQTKTPVIRDQIPINHELRILLWVGIGAICKLLSNGLHSGRDVVK